MIKATILALVFIAVILNIFQFYSIEEEARHNYKALNYYKTGNLFEIAIDRDNSARRRVAPV